MGAEGEGAIEFLGVAGEQIQAALLEVRMFEDTGHEPFAQSVAAMLFRDDHIANVSHRGFVRDDPGHADLFRRLIYAETKRVADATGDGATAAIFGPVSAPDQAANRIQVEPFG